MGIILMLGFYTIILKNQIQSIVDIINKLKKVGTSSYQHLCRERAERLFNKDDRYKEYIDLYCQLVKS
jgi:putative colanic acid biosynthesis glycosyltransferase